MSIVPQSGLDFVAIDGGSEDDGACTGEDCGSDADVQADIIAIVRATNALFTTAGRLLIRLEGSALFMVRPPPGRLRPSRLPTTVFLGSVEVLSRMTGRRNTCLSFRLAARTERR